MRRLWLMILLVAGLASPASAQETTGTITGVTIDQSGAVVPGVTVTVKNTATNDTRTVVTNAAGIYSANLLPIGSYDITFDLAGFQTVSVKNVTLHVNDRLQINGHMSVGGVTEAVNVTAMHELVQPIPALQTTMGSRQVQELPLNNRNFAQLATLAPGVSNDLSDEVGIGLTSTMSISVNGARRNALNWLVDGVSNVDVGSNITLLSTPTIDSIEEFKIITNGYAAEWPRSGGGIVNVVTKSGSNTFSGNLYEFLRNDKLNANSFFRNLSTTLDVSSHPPNLRYNNFGGTLGGPAIKDKFFFFYSEEARRIIRAPASVTANVPDPAWLTDPTNANYVAPALRDPSAVKYLALYPAPNVAGTQRYISSQPAIQNTLQEVVRLDYELNPNHRLTGRYTHDNSFTEEPGGLFSRHFRFGFPRWPDPTLTSTAPARMFLSPRSQRQAPCAPQESYASALWPVTQPHAPSDIRGAARSESASRPLDIVRGGDGRLTPAGSARVTDRASRVPGWHADDPGCSGSPIHEGSSGDAAR